MDGIEPLQINNIHPAYVQPDNIRPHIPSLYLHICSSHSYTLPVPANSISKRSVFYNAPVQRHSHPKAFRRKSGYKELPPPEAHDGN